MYQEWLLSWLQDGCYSSKHHSLTPEYQPGPKQAWDTCSHICLLPRNRAWKFPADISLHSLARTGPHTHPWPITVQGQCVIQNALGQAWPIVGARLSWTKSKLWTLRNKGEWWPRRGACIHRCPQGIIILLRAGACPTDAMWIFRDALWSLARSLNPLSPSLRLECKFYQTVRHAVPASHLLWLRSMVSSPRISIYKSGFHRGLQSPHKCRSSINTW